MDETLIALSKSIKLWASKHAVREIPIVLQETKKDFEGDITLMVFAILKVIKGNPAVLATEIGEHLKRDLDFIQDFNVVKGFLNLIFTDAHHLNRFYRCYGISNHGHVPLTDESTSVMVEYSSPNTNKPLHLGHIRNNLLGYSMANILKAAGHKVYKTQIINDRGIHICKSMVAWQRFAEGATPETTHQKGDKFVGDYYVAFDKAYKREIQQLIAEGQTEQEAEQNAPIFLEARELLRKWENADANTVALWEKMNAWVYEGFEQTYQSLGVDFDKNYYESQTYLIGKKIVKKGLEAGVFYQKEDGGVWIDLTADRLGEKIVLRSDGTAVYMTQDIGTAVERFEDFDINSLIYTVGNEQDHHFKVLFIILAKMGYDWAQQLYHLSYGMVDLPSGKMKSREGTVVDADDLVADMISTAAAIAQELGKLEGYDAAQKQDCYRKIGLGALKYFLLKVDPQKRIVFNPKKSIDFQGNTGPFVQYTYARIQSILRKVDFNIDVVLEDLTLDSKEKELLNLLANYPNVIQLAADQKNPAKIANYIYDLVKAYNSFYQAITILGCTDISLKTFRVQLSKKVGDVIADGLDLLGIEVLDRM